METNKKNLGTAKVPTIIGSDVVMIGDIITDGNVQINGRFEGNVTAMRLTVGELGAVQGLIKTEHSFIMGKVVGKVVSNIIEIADTGNVHADVCTDQFLIANGAFFDGKCTRLTKKEVPETLVTKTNNNQTTNLKEMKLEPGQEGALKQSGLGIVYGVNSEGIVEIPPEESICKNITLPELSNLENTMWDELDTLAQSLVRKLHQSNSNQDLYDAIKSYASVSNNRPRSIYHLYGKGLILKSKYQYTLSAKSSHLDLPSIDLIRSDIEALLEIHTKLIEKTNHIEPNKSQNIELKDLNNFKNALRALSESLLNSPNFITKEAAKATQEAIETDDILFLESTALNLLKTIAARFLLPVSAAITVQIFLQTQIGVSFAEVAVRAINITSDWVALNSIVLRDLIAILASPDIQWLRLLEHNIQNQKKCIIDQTKSHL